MREDTPFETVRKWATRDSNPKPTACKAVSSTTTPNQPLKPVYDTKTNCVKLLDSRFENQLILLEHGRS